MKKEYKLTIEVDDELFADIDIPYYSGPYHDWLRNKIILALRDVRGAPSHIRIEMLKEHELAAIQFANVLVNYQPNERNGDD